jgi:hypothetical protein
MQANQARIKSSPGSSSVASSFPLSTPLLVHVLGFLQLPQRLGSAALVCKAWREAANAATTSISHTFNWENFAASQRQLHSIPAWLARGTAQHVTALHLDSMSGMLGDEEDLAQVFLPLQQLCKLRSLKLLTVELLKEQLQGHSRTACIISISSSSSNANPLAGISSSLTALELADVQLNSFSSTQELFCCMSSLSKLQRLELDGVRVQPQDDVELDSFTESCSGEPTLADALRQMPQLTRLSLAHHWECQLGYEVIPGLLGAALAGLQQLQELELSGFRVAEARPRTLFKQLPASLTKLQVSGPANVPGHPLHTCQVSSSHYTIRSEICLRH